MSERNGDKSRFQIARKRGVIRRAKIRAIAAASAGQTEPAKSARTAKPRTSK